MYNLVNGAIATLSELILIGKVIRGSLDDIKAKSLQVRSILLNIFSKRGISF